MTFVTPSAEQNGHATPGAMTNGATPNGATVQVSRPAGPSSPAPAPYERSVILRQSPLWARLVVWGIVGVSAATVIWACLAKIEEAVPAPGKLEPQGVVQPVQAPVGGVIETIRVREGESVEQGQVLVTLDPRSLEAELSSQREIQRRLVEENEFYRSQLADGADADIAPATVSAEIARLTSNRATLIAENDLYRAILRGDSAGSLSPQQRQRAQATLGDLNAELAINQLEVDQLSKQLDQVRERLANARSALAVEQEILGRIGPLVEAGAVADLQYLQQEQEVNNRLTEVNTLQEEETRLSLAITQAGQRLRQISDASNESLLDRIAQNDTQIANIDSQITKVIVENEKQLEQVAGQIRQLEYALNNQTLRAPVAGKVFNLKANQPGYVANTSEPILEIVPDGNLVARVFVTNRDIGFVKQQFEEQEQLQVDVRIDSFSFSEFGDIEGTVIHIASDALPPDQVNPYYRFPVEVELADQRLSEVFSLQSGMSVTANIKLRKRRVITILSDLFVRKLDSLKSGG